MLNSLLAGSVLAVLLNGDTTHIIRNDAEIVSETQTAETYRTEAKRYLDDEDVGDAEPYLDKLNINDPANFALFGEYFFLRGEKGRAKNFLYRSLRENPNDSTTLNLLAVYHLHFGPENGAELALGYLNRAIKISPNEPDFYFNRALTYELFFEDFQHALSDYKKGYELTTDHAKKREFANQIAALYFSSTYNNKKKDGSKMTILQLLEESVRWWKIVESYSTDEQKPAVEKRIGVAEKLIENIERTREH